MINKGGYTLKILIIGSGAKEHALAWMFSKSRRISGLYVAPGNAGTDALGTNLSHIDPSDAQAILKACETHQIDYVFAGTETPLAAGVTDVVKEAGYPVFGAPKSSQRLESDRGFARSFMARHDIPHNSYFICSTLEEAEAYIDSQGGNRLVIKRNGLATSREMIDCKDKDCLLNFAREQLKIDPIIIEDHLKGLPITLTVLIDGENYLILPNCSEYTKSEENERGQPTGGMGAICPVPILNQAMHESIISRIVEPTLKGMQEEGLSYQGVLLFSLILHDETATVVDYHVRFNDPATQALLPLIKSDFMDILQALHNHSIASFPLEVSEKSSVAVVLASSGYPSHPEAGKTVTSLPYMGKPEQMLFYGAVDRNEQVLLTTGGRCFTAVGLGTNIQEANERAYALVPEIDFEGKWFRNDIGNKFFE